MRIFILDEIQVKPGAAADYRRAYRANYVPGAEDRGMTLEQAWQSPPGRDYGPLPVTLYYLWSVPGVSEWWAMRFADRFGKLAWWRTSSAMILSRKRTMLTRQPED